MSNQVVKQLPDELRDLIGTGETEINNVGCSGAVVIHLKEIAAFGRPAYLKFKEYDPIESLEYEVGVLRWLQGKLPVPEVLYYNRIANIEYLLMSEIEGEDCSDEVMRAQPKHTVRQLAYGLKQIHSLDISDCPLDQRLDVKLEKARQRVELGLVDEEDFDEERTGRTARDVYELTVARRPTYEDLVFTHGDYCLPNIILKNGRLSGFIDLGRAGVADRYQDIGLAVRSIRFNLEDEKWVEAFLGCYGIEEADWERIEYYILLDELF